MNVSDFRELFNSPEEAVRGVVAGMLKEFFIAMPVTVHKDTEDGHKVAVQPAIKAQVRQEDGTTKYEDYPVLDDVPIQFSGGANHHFTHPVKKGDEGFVLFASRNIDTWYQSGGTQQPIDNRIGNLSDGHFIPGIHSKPNQIKNYSKDSAQVRHGDNAESKVDVSKTGTLNQRGTDSQVHVTDTGVLTRKSNSATLHTPEKIDQGAPKIMLNC